MKTSSLKAFGDDNIQNIALKNISRNVLVKIYIINGIIKISYFLQCWKTSIGLSALKLGKNPAKLASCGPISLLSSLSKITEKIALNRIKKNEKQSRQSIHSLGSRNNTIKQVVRLVNNIRRNYDKNKITVMVLLYIEKAFDRV